jgi:hypothetical protein
MADLGAIGFGRFGSLVNITGVSFSVSGEVRDSSGNLVGKRTLMALTHNAAAATPAVGTPVLLGATASRSDGTYTVSTGMNTSDVTVVCLDPTLNAKVASLLTAE